MEKAKTIITMTGVFMLLFSYGNMSGNIYHSDGSNSVLTSSISVQTKTKSTQAASKSLQTKTKSTQTDLKSAQTKTKPAKTTSKTVQTKTKSIPKSTKSETANKGKNFGTVRIGTQNWATANLNVVTFRNGDSIPEARTNKEWMAAGESGKPAWCYYKNDPAIGLKYGKLYNWYAVNDPRGLAPAGWTLPGEADWAELTYYAGGQAAGRKMKSTSGWSEGNNGTNETGFTGLPAGYRVENGAFLNSGSIGTWWSSTEDKTLSAFDHYLAMSGSLSKSSSPKQRGESVRCLRK
jgi:uncharacterized protein (TIGR02145 family)